MAFCLIKPVAEQFKRMIESGELRASDLIKMTSEQRHAAFAKVVGAENAKPVNSLFESRLLLKNQKAAFLNWADKIVGNAKARPDIISKINKLDRVLNPAEKSAFLKDLAAQKLGTDVSFEQVKKISELASQVRAFKESALAGKDRVKYGEKLVEFHDYMNSLKESRNKISLKDIKNAPVQSLGKGISNLGGLAKSLKASLDNSVIGRQGLKTLFSHPSVWLKNSIKSFEDMVRAFGGKEVVSKVKAEVLSRPNALNGLYEKEKLALGNIEEAYPTSLPEKIPVLGRAFKASEAAFNAFQLRTRADVFDKLVQIADKTGGDIKGIGQLANSLTGRGNIGKFEHAATTLNNLFFSPRFLKSNIDFLTAHRFDSDMGSFAKKRAAINLAKTIGGIASILAISNAVAPGSVEVDPRSSNFGKIKIGDTRFDVSGGMSSILTLAARLFSMSTKSSLSGKVTPLNSGGFGSRTGVDVVEDFIEGKLAPIAGVLRDYLKGHDMSGQKPTLASTANNLLTPLPITNYNELKDHKNSAPMLAAMIADALGIGTNTYSKDDYKKKKTLNKIKD